MGSTTGTIRNCAIAAGCARHDANFRADSLRCRSTPGRLPPRSRPVTREALPAPWCCRSTAPRSRPVVLPTCCAPGRLPTCCPWCCRPVLPTCRVAGQLPAGCPRSRPVTWEALPAPWCCRRAAAGQLPAGCRRAARGAAGPCCRRVALPVNSRPVAHAPGPSLGKRCRPRGAADVPRCRSTPGRLPTCCPWCCRPVLPTCCAAGQLPAGCPRSRPVTREALPARGAASQDRPHAPGPWCCRRAALPAGCRRAGLPAPRRCRSTPGRVPRRRLSNRGRKWLET